MHDTLTSHPVPYLDLAAHHAPNRERFNHAIAEVIESGAFAGGRFVEQFESEFAPYCGCAYSAGVGSGTEALWLALLGLGIGPGDEVITSTSTFIATAEAISFCGATPVFVDVDERRYTMNPEVLEAALTERTRAIIPVHLFGQPADMDPILTFARRHGLKVIEDAAQAHGAEYKERRIGSLGDAGCFSFYPGKNLGAFGEAGAVVTNDADLFHKIQRLRDHGQAKKYYHSVVGWNGRMDGIQAAVLSIKLAELDANNALRASHAARYDRLFAPIAEITTPFCAEDVQHVYHIYEVRVPERDRVLEELTEAGIGCGIHYPVPVHLQEAYRGTPSAKASCPVAERHATEFLSLPMFPELTPQQIERVAECLIRAVGRQTHLASDVA